MRRWTTDAAEVRAWAEARGARLARVRGTEGLLRLAFDPPPPHWELVPWDDLQGVLYRHNLAFVYEDDPASRYHRFVKR